MDSLRPSKTAPDDETYDEKEGIHQSAGSYSSFCVPGCTTWDGVKSSSETR